MIDPGAAIGWAGLLVGVLLALAAAFAARGAVFAFHRRARAALGSLAAAALFFVLSPAALAVAAFHLQPGADDPQEGFRGLFALAIDIAFVAAWVVVLALPLAFAAAALAHRRARREPR